MPTDIYSWIWWFFTAIILGILVNIVSDYLKPMIDLVRAKYSEKQREINKEEENKINKIVNNMLEDQRELLHITSMIQTWETRRVAQNILGFVSLIFIMIMADTSDLPTAIFIFLFFCLTSYALLNTRVATLESRKYRKIYEAYRKTRGLSDY